jgi:predicted transcriptional regulator
MKIFNHTKKFEFRRAIFKKEKIQDVIIYASHPVQKIVGRFQIGKILEASPEQLWSSCNNFAGIEKEAFFEYFHDKTIGYAIEIQNLEQFSNTIDPKTVIPDFHPPQSYCYTNISVP